MSNTTVTKTENEIVVDPQPHILSISKGTITLATPITVRDKQVTEIKYDFSKVTGREYADALDEDTRSMNIYRLTAKQALSLFARAVSKVTENVDPTDVKEQIGVQDSVKAIQLSSLFFAASAKAGNDRISND